LGSIQTEKVALITGVTGQDGAYLSQFLLGKCYEVYGIVRQTGKPNISNLKYLRINEKVKLLNSDLADLPKIINVIEQIRPDEIYNLAAQSSVALSFAKPIATYEFNTKSTLNLLEAIRTINPDIKLYQASSSEMYGNIDRDDLPVTEKHYLNPASPYGVSKASAHMLTKTYRESYGLFASCGILFNHESCLRGKNFVTKKVIETAVRISRGVEHELILGDLQICRDWGYAPEYIKAMWLILQAEHPDDFIICSGSCHSLEEFVSVAFSCLDMDYRQYVKHDGSLHRPSELTYIFGNNHKAVSELNWDYRIDFKQLVEHLVNDEKKYQDNLNC